MLGAYSKGLNGLYISGPFGRGVLGFRLLYQLPFWYAALGRLSEPWTRRICLAWPVAHLSKTMSLETHEIAWNLAGCAAFTDTRSMHVARLWVSYTKKITCQIKKDVTNHKCLEQAQKYSCDGPAANKELGKLNICKNVLAWTLWVLESCA